MRSLVKRSTLLFALALFAALPLGASAGKGGNPNATGPSAGNPNVEMVSYSPASGPVGTIVTITGTGWRQHRGEVVSLAMCIPDASPVATATVATDGTFAFPSVTIPGTGLYWMYNASHCVFTVRGDGVAISYWWAVTS